jgi:hypothetical protein
LALRAHQTNFGELPSFTLAIEYGQLTKDLLQEAISERVGCQDNNDLSNPIFIVDSSEDDFGSRANFGRGHVESEFENGCLTSYEVFLRRLANVAVNKLNVDMAKDICVVGSIDSADLTNKCRGLRPQIPSERAILLNSVLEHHHRLSNVISSIYAANHSTSSLRGGRVYLVNGDHNHMLSAIAAVYSSGVKPTVVYIDLHADSRPVQDGPHSGTWCSEAFEYGWIEQVQKKPSCSNSRHLN